MSANEERGILRQAPVYYRGLLDTSASAICFASATNSRWNLISAEVGWTNVSTIATLQFVEGAAGAVFFQFEASTSQGFAAFNLGYGIQASGAGTSFRFVAGSSESGSFSVAFSGYYTGGG